MKHKHARPFAPPPLQQIHHYYGLVCRHCLTSTLGVCFPFLRFDRATMTSLVPSYRLTICPANLTPDETQPVIRRPPYFVSDANVTTRFSHRLALSRLHHWFTRVQLIMVPATEINASVFPQRSPPHRFLCSSLRCFDNSPGRASPGGLSNSLVRFSHR